MLAAGVSVNAKNRAGETILYLLAKNKEDRRHGCREWESLRWDCSP